MDLLNLLPKQLERLEQAAQKELDPRARRRPASEVREMLHAAAAAAGFSLDEVFPEWPKSRRRPAGRQPRQPVDATPDPPPGRSHSPRGAGTTLPPPPWDASQELVRAMAVADPRAFGKSQALDELRKSVGLEQDWPGFHAALELAVRRNWVHYRGNTHCALTSQGLEAAGV